MKSLGWLAQVKGGGTMHLRSSDPNWIAQVDAWWDFLLPKLKRFMHVNGGPVLMVQVRWRGSADLQLPLRHVLMF